MDNKFKKKFSHHDDRGHELSQEIERAEMVTKRSDKGD